MISRLYYPHVGGVEMHLSHINRILQKKGFNITVVTEKFDGNLATEEFFDNVRILRFSYPNIKVLGLVFIWIWFFKNLNVIKNSDLVHIHDVFIWFLPFRLLFYRKPVFTTFHGWEGKYPVPLNNKLQKRIASWLSNGTIAVGEYIQKYYGIKTDLVTFGATEVPKKLTKKQKNYIVFIGRLDADTGLPLFLKILPELKKYRIDFCGDGPLKFKCQEFGKVHGFINTTPLLLRAKYCFCGGYLSILEALAHKCLVIVGYENHLKRDCFKLTPFSKFIVVENSAKKIRESINYYSKNYIAANKLIKDGFEWVTTQTWERVTQQYLNLWKLKI